MNAPGGRGYAVDSQRTLATRALAERCGHRLFLSATPHNGFSESFTALLEMIDGRRFSRGATLDEQALRDVTVRRLKAELPEKEFEQRRCEQQVPWLAWRDLSTSGTREISECMGGCCKNDYCAGHCIG